MMRVDRGVEFFIELLEQRVPFTFMRFGDGEFMCMREGLLKVKARAKNCDGHPYTVPLALDLKHVLASPGEKIHYGIQNSLAKLMGLSDEECEKAVDALAPRVLWSNGDVFHHASIKGQLGAFSAALFARHPVMVGPPCFEKFPVKLRRIEIPAKACYDAKQEIKKAIFQHYQDGARVFSVSASMAAKPIIHELHNVLPGATFLDMGAVWDPYCGVNSRRYHQKLTPEILKRNLGR